MLEYLKEIIYILGKDKSKTPLMLMFFVLISMLEVVGIGLIAPYVALIIDQSAPIEKFSWVFNILGLDGNYQLAVILLGCLLLIIFIIKAVSSIWINKIIVFFSQNQQVKLRSYLMHAYQNISYEEYLHRNSSEYIRNIQETTGQFSGGVLLPLLRLVSDSIVAIFIIILLAYQDIVALISLVMLVGILAYSYDKFFRYKLKDHGSIANASAASIVKAVNEGIEGLKEIRIYNKEQYFYNIVNKNSKKFAYSNSMKQVISSAPRYLLEAVAIGFVVSLVIISSLSESGLDSILPTLSIFAIASIRLIPSFNIILTSILNLRYGRNSVSILYKDLKNLKKIKTIEAAKNTKLNNELFQSFELERVNYSYPFSTERALSNISLKFLPGESIGIVGPSGSGKTTLVDLILGLVVPQSGSVLYNKRTLALSLNVWRSKIAYIPQKILLIDDTLRKNIALGIPENEIDDRKIQDSIKRAMLSEVVEKMPIGVDTVIGERGTLLSGGQMQRVALARAFYHDRSVLIMDESTSALDSEMENEVVEQMRFLHGTMTIIVIAHRVTTLKYCDRIIKIDNGEILTELTYKRYVELIKT